MMTHPYDDIEAFALGALDGDQALAVLAHADGCVSCAVLMAGAMRAASAFEPPRERPPRFKSARVARLQPREGSRPPIWIASVAAAAAIALLVWNLNLRSNTLPVPVASLVHSHFEHHPLRGAADAGSAKVIQALDGSWVYVVADGLSPHKEYSLYVFSGDEGYEVGKVTSTSAGQAAGYWAETPRKITALVLKPTGAAGVSGGEILRWP